MAETIPSVPTVEIEVVLNPEEKDRRFWKTERRTLEVQEGDTITEARVPVKSGIPAHPTAWVTDRWFIRDGVKSRITSHTLRIPTHHTVAEGETLYVIAKAQATTPIAIRELNGMALTDTIEVGQVLVVRR